MQNYASSVPFQIEPLKTQTMANCSYTYLQPRRWSIDSLLQVLSCALNSPCISAKHDETPFGSASLPLCSVIRSEITFKWTFVWYTTFSLLLVSWRLFYEFRPPESLRYFYFFYVFSKGPRSSKRSAYISQRCVFSSWMMIYWPCRCSSQVGRLVR